jgi:hypothetical protein
MNSQLRLIGDVHGKHDKYLYLLEENEAPYTLQVGDFGFHYNTFDEHDIKENHCFIGGNHDNYDLIDDCPNHLGDFGVWSVPDMGDVFYIRGGWSIDKAFRSPGVSWWPDEELSQDKCEEALELYKEVKPKFVVSHECPLDIVQFVTNPQFAKDMGHDSGIIMTKTNRILLRMREFHAPKMHVFGHYHKHLDIVANEVRYVCLPELGTLDLPKNFINAL